MEKNNAISSDLIRGHIDTIILYALLDGDKFAQQIIDSVDKKSDGGYSMNQATLYSSLKRLENLKLVSSYWFDSDGGRRKYFSITEDGRSTVENNLLNWSYSRGIIDKLMDCEPQPIYKTQIVEVPKEIIREVVKEVPVQSPIPAPEITPIKPQNDVSEANNVVIDNKTTSPDQEVNYKGILDEIIKSTVVERVANEELKPILNEKNIEESPKESDKLKLNDTLISEVYNTPMNSNVGKIDFGDMALNATKEGYKLRISSKDIGQPYGKVRLNKLNFFSSLLIYLIAIFEFFFILNNNNDILGFNTLTNILIIAGLTVFPTINLVKFLIKPKKTADKISGDSIFTSLIVVFNLILVTFAGNLLFGTDFTNVKEVLMGIIIPSVLFLNILIYFVLRFVISKSKHLTIQKKK